MMSLSDKALRRAVIKASVLLWYGQSDLRNIAVKTYLRKGKEKATVTWEYTVKGDDGTTEPRFGVMLVFASPEDLESNFDDLCQLAVAERRSAVSPAQRSSAAA